MSCIIRTARLTDIESMHVIRLAVRENRLGEASGITTASYRPYVIARSAWVAERDDALVGFAAAEQATANVWALFVAPAAEGGGVGHALHEAILAWAAVAGLDRLGLTTAAGTRAERFYRSRGWRAGGVDAMGQISFERGLSC